MNLHVAQLRRAVTALAVAATLALTGSTASQAGIPDYQVTIGATGIKDPLYSTPGTAPAAWTNLGGRLASAPSVVVAGGLTHYIGIGINGYLYHRTADTPWAQMAPTTFRCKYVSAVAYFGDVYMACTGLNKALYYVDFADVETAPMIQTWSKADGLLVDGPATAFPGEYWLAKGPAYDNGDGTTGNLYRHDGSQWAQTGGWCDTPPALADSPTASVLAMACGLTADNGTRSIYVSTYDYFDDNETSLEVAGATDYAPALAVNGDGNSFALVVQGTNAKVYTKTIAFDDLERPWTNLGGVVKFGVGASSNYVPPLLPKQVDASKLRGLFGTPRS